MISNEGTSVCLLYIQKLLHVSAPLGHLQGVLYTVKYDVVVKQYAVNIKQYVVKVVALKLKCKMVVK